MLAVEAPRSLRGFPLFQPRVHPPGSKAGSVLQGRPPGADGRFLGRAQGTELQESSPRRSLGMTILCRRQAPAVEAPRGLRGFPLLLRRVHSLNADSAESRTK